VLQKPRKNLPNWDYSFDLCLVICCSDVFSQHFEETNAVNEQTAVNPVYALVWYPGIEKCVSIDAVPVSGDSLVGFAQFIGQSLIRLQQGLVNPSFYHLNWDHWCFPGEWLLRLDVCGEKLLLFRWLYLFFLAIDTFRAALVIFLIYFIFDFKVSFKIGVFVNIKLFLLLDILLDLRVVLFHEVSADISIHKIVRKIFSGNFHIFPMFGEFREQVLLF